MQSRPLIAAFLLSALWNTGCSQAKPAAGTAAAPPPAQAAPAGNPPSAVSSGSKPVADTSASGNRADDGAHGDAPAAGASSQTGAATDTGPAGGHDAGMIKTSSGLEYQDVKVGKGPMPQAGQRVYVDYIGSLSDGTQFDNSLDRPDAFSFVTGMGEVIKGWDEGIRTMRVGGQRILIVPPNLAYGPNGQGKIPANATLTFLISLHSIGKP